MKQYFSRITMDHWCVKNQLHGAVLEIAKSMDRMLIDEVQLPVFKKTLTDRINHANLTFRKCKPFRLYMDKHKDFENIYVNDVFQMEIIEVNKFNEK